MGESRPRRRGYTLAVQVATATQGFWRTASEQHDNPFPQRSYPWSDEFSPDNANAAMNVGSTSTPGCFDAGRSPYGCDDMAGNVWEWTRSRYAPYPYRSDDGREPAQPKAGDLVVVRGGAFYYDRVDARCAYRLRSRPGNRYYGLGFRVVLRSPVPSL